MFGNVYNECTMQPMPASPMQSALDDLSGIIGAIQENLADLAGRIDPVLRPQLQSNKIDGCDNAATPAYSCELESGLRSKIEALTIINGALISLNSRVAL